MPFHIINISLRQGGQTGEELFYTDALNHFCVNKRILWQKVKFFTHQGKPFWSVFLEYESVLEESLFDKKTKKEIDMYGLTQAGRLCLEKLKEWRKEKAEREGVPAFIIAKDSQFTQIIKKEIVTLEGLKQIHGFGDKKVQKYGKEITSLVKAFFHEADVELSKEVT